MNNNNMSYLSNESLNQSQNEQMDQQDQILPSELQEIDFIDETQNITFNFSNYSKIHIPIPSIPKLISLQKFYHEEFKQILKNLEVNHSFAHDGLNIQTQAEESYHKSIQIQIQQYINTINTQKLDLDYDSQRTFFRSNYILKQCEPLKYYIIKYKNSDQKIEIHLVTQQEDYNIVVHNLQQTLKGLRIFFLDVTNHMTSPKVNIDHKYLLAQLRQQYFKNIISDDLEQSFKNLEFLDVIDQNKSFGSVILGFQFPFELQGKQMLCQEIFTLIKKMIESLFVIFIQFNPNEDNLSQAKLIENLINNFKLKNRFQCVCKVDTALKVIAILGTPENIKIIFNEVLKEKKDKFTKEFISSFQICVLKKNFEYTPRQQSGSFQLQVSDSLKKKQNIEISNHDQLFIIKFLVKVSIDSYWNLINFLCEQKIQQDREKVLISELERITQKINKLELKGKLIDRLKQKVEKITYPQQSFRQMPHQQINQNSQIQNQNSQILNQNSQILNQNSQILNQNQILPQNLVQPNEQLQEQQQLPSTIQTSNQSQPEGGLEQQQELFSIFTNNNIDSEYENPEQQIIFNEPIVRDINDGTGSIRVTQEYLNYFQQLVSENNQDQIGFILIKESQLLELKLFSKELEIYYKHDDFEISQDMIIVQVKINGNAEKKNNNLDQVEQYYQVTQNNQILPVKKILQ